MSQVSYKVPHFTTINGKKICILIDYYRLLELRKLGMKDRSDILADVPAKKEAA